MNNKPSLIALYLAAFLALATNPAQAQNANDFFTGGSVPGGGGQPAAEQAAANAQANAPAGDYTADEKRMQKKYQANLAAAQQLVQKGDKMMKDGESKKLTKVYKKGKILKEIGEKRVQELKANNPMAELTGK